LGNQSVASDSTGPTLSQVPPIRSFEFDKNAIGNIKNSVNQFRGSVSLPIDILMLPGREGLDVKVTAIYSSAVKNDVTAWNITAATGILGLGWQMPFDLIAVDKGGSGSNSDDTYFLVAGGSSSPMVKTGETAGGEWTFQLRNYQFWDVRYDPSHQLWTIVKEDGVTSTFGGVDRALAAIQWGVKWGNWIGSSSEPAGQEQYPVAWNLVSIGSPLGSRVVFSYDSVERRVGADGAAFTQACYLKTVVDSYGRKLTFNYAEKFGADNPSPRGIVEYQALDSSQPGPNAYQDKYETRYLDRIDAANSAGEALYSVQFTYSFVNYASTTDPYYGLMWKRCLASVYQYGLDGATLPALRFTYTGGEDTNPGALQTIKYPSGGIARYRYKKNLIFSPKRVAIANPLRGSVPGVWHGSDYVVFTYCQPVPTSGFSVIVNSWAGQWVTEDITAAAMHGVSADPKSVRVFAYANYIALSLRNITANCDELYLYRKDETQFGNWVLYNNQRIRLDLKSTMADPSTFAAGSDFIIAYNKDYSNGQFQGFSYNWRDGTWSAPPLPSSAGGASVALAALENYCIIALYFADQRRAQFQIHYRDLEGAWHSPASWSNSGLDIASAQGQLLFAWTPQPSYAVATYVTGSSASEINYSLRVFQWDEGFYVLNASDPAVLDLQSPISGGKARYEIFRTPAAGALVANNLGNLRTIRGGFASGGSANWLSKKFPTPNASATVTFASGDDIAVMCANDGGRQSNWLLTFDPNFPTDAGWSLTGNISQVGGWPTVSGDYMTVGRTIYFRGTDGSWVPLDVQLYNLGDEQSIQNRGPRYIAYQDGDGSGAVSYVVTLRNGQAATPQPLAGEPQKVHVPAGEGGPGTMLAGPRFLVGYPSSASFSAASTLYLYDLDEADLGDYTFDYPVAHIQVDDPYKPARPFVQSYFYADSEQSMIGYNAATGISQYPLVYVVPGVASTDDDPPISQPEGRSEFYYSNGVSPQANLRYPQGWIYNYSNVLNGMLLARRDYDSAGSLVASQLNYWQAFNSDAVAGANLFGAYVRLVRTTATSDGITQDSVTEFDPTTGVQLWQEQSYTNADGTTKILRAEKLYAWQVEEYADAFRAQHIYTAVVQSTKSVSDEGRRNRTYIESQVTTFRNWAESAVTVRCTDPTRCRLAAHSSYQWTKPGEARPQFDFSSSGNHPDWLLNLDVVARSDPGWLIEEQRDCNGVPTSFLYDKEQRYLVAKFPNGSRAGGEVSYCGFEDYEAGQGWVLGSGAAVVPNPTSPVIDAHIGMRSVRLAPGATGAAGIARSFQPGRQGQPYRFSAWVKKPPGFDPGKGDARWLIAVDRAPPVTVDFPATVGSWVYLSQAIELPAPSGAVASVRITGENANTASCVLVDDLTFSPLSCTYEATGYDKRFWAPNALLGANGEANRTVFDEFQQPVLASAAADALAKISASYFSRAGNKGIFAVGDPNTSLALRPAGDGALTSFTRGAEWQALWNGTPGVWEVVGAKLMQRGGGQLGTLATVDPRYRSSYALAANFATIGAPSAPIGLRIGDALTVLWQPTKLQWELNDSSGSPLLPPVSIPLFELPARPYTDELDAGEISAALTGLFNEAGYPLPAGSTVMPGAADGGSWTLTAPSEGYRYDLQHLGPLIGVNRLDGRWIAVVDGQSFIFWVGGRRIFSYLAPNPLDGAPEFFFDSRVAIAQLAAGLRPQTGVSFADPHGIAIQSQLLSDDRAIVSQTVPDDQGRDAVRTKAAYITGDQNPLLSYCENFAVLDWSTGLMSGLIVDAYPEDDFYPYSRSVYDPSPVDRVVQQGMPGAQFRVGAHATRISYGNRGYGLADEPGALYQTTVVNPNNDAYSQMSNELGQVVAKVSLKDGIAIKNVTLFDDAGNPVELRSPNYFAPPAGSTPKQWAIVQTFDYAGHITSITSGEQHATAFIYDRAGNLRFMQDPQGAEAGNYCYYKYDLLNRVIEWGYLTGSWNTADLQRVADADPTQPSTPPTWRKKYAYDNTSPARHSIGRCWQIEVNNGNSGSTDVTEGFAYDVRGKTITRTLTAVAFDPAADNRVDYEFDNLGNIARITYPDVGGQRLDLYYRNNAAGQITAIAENPDFTVPLCVFAYSASGRPESDALRLDGGAGVTRRFSFNSPLWITSIEASGPTGDLLFGESLSYTEGGYNNAAYYDGTIAASRYRRAGASPVDYEFQYSYNSVGQIENAKNSVHSVWNLGVSASVAYDPNGNFTLAPQGGVARQYSYYPGTQMLKTVIDRGDGTELAASSYDANGNATTFTSAASGTAGPHDLALAYDPGSKMTVRVVDGEGHGRTLDFQYGGFDQRVLKEVRQGGALLSRKLYVRGTNASPLCEVVAAPGKPASASLYIFGPGGLVALRKGGVTYTILKDHLGSVRAVLGPQAEVVASYDYYAFGTLAAAAEPEPDFISYLFTGQEYDSETGLYNYGARFYSGLLGRFISTDPANQYFSPYLYAANDPVLYVDPSGSFSIGSLFSAIAGAIIGAIEVLVGVFVDIVAGVLEVVTGGLSTPASIALASVAGAFYGAGTAAITYSVFNFDNFDWRDYGIQMGIGAVAGALTAGFGAAGSAAAEAATGVQAAIEAGQQVTTAARAANALIEGSITVAGGAVTTTVVQSLNDVASGVTPGADIGVEIGWNAISDVAGALLPGASFKSGWGNLGKRILGSVGKSELIGLGVATTRNLAEGNPWDQGLLNAAFGGLLNGSIDGLQVQDATKGWTQQALRALAPIGA